MGAAELRPRLVLPGEFGTLSYAPPAIGGGMPLVIAGEAALSSDVSVMLEGARDALDSQLSGAAAGLRWHLLPKESRLQLSVTGGGVRRLIGSMYGPYVGSTGLFSQINASYDVGRLRFSGVLRATSSGSANFDSIAAAGAVTYDLKPVRVGIEYFVVGDKAFDDKTGLRSAFSAWVGVPLANERISLRASTIATNHSGIFVLLGVVLNF